MFQDISQSYKAALRLWLPLVSAHVFIRMVVASLMVPVIGFLLASTLVFSDQTALTDQDIAWFLLTPAGAVGALIILSFMIVAMVLDVVMATAILRQRPLGLMETLRLASGFVLHSIPRLLPFVAQFLFRVLLILLPYLAVAGAVAFVFLREHDINYYLSQRPPDFLIAAGLIGLVVLALAVTLLARLSGWAVALHLALFDAVPPARAFDESRRQMTGHRWALIQRLLGWIAVRAVAGLCVGAIAGLVVTWIGSWQADSLRTLAIAVILGGLLYSAANALINAVSNGALADILNDEFERALFGRKPALDMDRFGHGDALPRHQGLVIGGVALLSLLGLGTGGLLLERLEREASVEVIAHRGAAALAPENTMASVMRALDDGADWIEIDVQESADGEVIVAHDSDFMKSSNVPTKVWDVTRDDLAGIDVGSWFDPAYASERVPLLIDVLEAARGRAGVIIELKYYGHDQDLERRVAAIVEEAGMADQISTMSLKYPAVQKMLALRPEWRTGVLAATSVGDLSGLDGDFLALNHGRINAQMISRAEDAGKDVYAWTVNDPMSMVRMLWIGVDGLITDDPALVREVVAAYNDLSIPERFILAIGNFASVTIAPEKEEDLRP